MNEVAANTLSPLSLGVVAVIFLVAMMVWFFVNRASVRASEQIRLLESLLEEQKKQNAMLRHLVDAQPSADKKIMEEGDKRDFIRLIPER